LVTKESPANLGNEGVENSGETVDKPGFPYDEKYTGWRLACLAVTCPVCGRPAGQRCEDLDSKAVRYASHLARWALVRAICGRPLKNRPVPVMPARLWFREQSEWGVMVTRGHPVPAEVFITDS